MTNKDKARLLRSAASALEHGRNGTATKKIAAFLSAPLLSSRELATVLAALRYWQQDLVENEDPPISDHFADQTPLTPDEIDTLCGRLNQ